MSHLTSARTKNFHLWKPERAVFYNLPLTKIKNRGKFNRLITGRPFTNGTKMTVLTSMRNAVKSASNFWESLGEKTKEKISSIVNILSLLFFFSIGTLVGVLNVYGARDAGIFNDVFYASFLDSKRWWVFDHLPDDTTKIEALDITDFLGIELGRYQWLAVLYHSGLKSKLRDKATKKIDANDWWVDPSFCDVRIVEGTKISVVETKIDGQPILIVKCSGINEFIMFCTNFTKEEEGSYSFNLTDRASCVQGPQDWETTTSSIPSGSNAIIRFTPPATAPQLSKIFFFSLS